MALSNNNSLGVHRPQWEQLAFAPATGIAGTNLVDDNRRYIYTYFQTSTTTAQFWRYDTWSECWQQLATPATQTGTIANMFYSESIGGQFMGKTYGSVFLFVGNSTVCYLYKYDIATNVWSANLGTTNVPAAFATDCYFMCPSPARNNWEGGYHSGVLRTITTSADAAVGATSITVGSLPEALSAGTRLRFGTFNITFTASATRGATSLAISALPQGLASDVCITMPDGNEIFTSSAVAAGATVLPVYPIQKAIVSGTITVFEQYAVLTASAAASATSITVSSLLCTIPNGSTGLYYGNAYLVGNNATVMYRYNFGANAWYTTSANSGNPAIPAVIGAVGNGCALEWLPAYGGFNMLFCLRGGATTSVYLYDLAANTWSSEVYNNQTETFGNGTNVATRSLAGKRSTLLIQKDTTMRIYEGNPIKDTLEPKLNQWLYPTGTAVAGNKSCCLTSPEGIEFYYILLPSSTAFLRAMLIDQ
jgi:hypothetical protein